MSRLGILILASGASSRLGQPKQLLNVGGKLLIQHIAEVAIASGCHPIGIVLGAYADTIKPHLADLNCHIFDNQDWTTGMASSIRCGMRNLLAIAPELDAIDLMICDQLFVSSHLIRQLIAKYSIIASEYAGVLGVPALFHRMLFPNLNALQGDSGAKAIIHQYRSRCLSIPFTEGSIDLDTPEDLKFLSTFANQQHKPLASSTYLCKIDQPN